MSKKFLLTGLWTVIALTAFGFGAVKANDIRNEGNDVSVSLTIDDESNTVCISTIRFAKGCRQGGCPNGTRLYQACRNTIYGATMDNFCVPENFCKVATENSSSSTSTTGGQDNNVQPNVPTTAPQPTCTPTAPGKVFLDDAKAKALVLSTTDPSKATITWLSAGGWGSRCGSKVKKQYTIRATKLPASGKCSTKLSSYSLATTVVESKLDVSKFNSSRNKVSFTRTNDTKLTFEAGQTYCIQVRRSNGAKTRASNIIKVTL